MRTMNEEEFFLFLENVLHGDDEHKEWLTDAFYAAWNKQPIPIPRGSGTKDRLYRELHRLQDELAKLKRETGHE